MRKGKKKRTLHSPLLPSSRHCHLCCSVEQATQIYCEERSTAMWNTLTSMMKSWYGLRGSGPTALVNSCRCFTKKRPRFFSSFEIFSLKSRFVTSSFTLNNDVRTVIGFGHKFWTFLVTLSSSSKLPLSGSPKGIQTRKWKKERKRKSSKKKSNLFLGKSKQVLSVCYSAVPLDFLLLYHLQPVFNFTYILGNIQLIQKSNQMVYMVSKKNFFQFHPDPFSWYSSQTFGIFFNCFQCSRFMIIRFFCYSSIKPAQINFLCVMTENKYSTCYCHSEN